MTNSARWPPAGVIQRRTDLRSTRDTLKSFDYPRDFFAEQCLARYLTVRAAGYLEAVRDDVSDQFCVTRASAEVVKRIRHNLRGGQGVAPSQIIEFVGTFRTEWAAELEDFLAANDFALKMSLGSLVHARKLIAHGDGESVTTGKALAWVDTVDVIAQWLISRFDPNKPVADPV